MSQVDVIVPCYNYGRYLPDCVESILAQEGVEVRVLIIDDASTDGSADVARAIARSDPRVWTIFHERNQGHIATYNEGLLDWAQSKYSLLLSADDALTPCALHRATVILDEFDHINMIFGQSLVVEEIPARWRHGKADQCQILQTAEFLNYCFERGNPVPTPTAVVRTYIQKQIGGYRQQLPHAGDMEMWMRFALTGPVAVLSSVQAFYRWHPANMTRRHTQRELYDLLQRLLACRTIVEQSAETYPALSTWLAELERRIGELAFWSASRAFDLGDTDTCEEMSSVARQLWPGLATEKIWLRFKLKRLLGNRTWRYLRATKSRLLLEPATSGEGTEPVAFGAGQCFGWWPETVADVVELQTDGRS